MTVLTMLAALRTPALVLDRGRLEGNLARMQARAAVLGVALRPHLKTAKSVEVARLATAGQPGGITVSTLAEAEQFARGGFRDITYGVGITPDTLADVAVIQQRTGAAIACCWTAWRRRRRSWHGPERCPDVSGCMWRSTAASTAPASPPTATN